MPTMRERVQKLEGLRAKIKEMGGSDKVQKQHERGKLTARERLDILFDKDTFFEIGISGTPMPGGSGDKRVNADAVVTGWGKVDGRPVAAVSYDFTVKGGSIGFTGEKKCARLREFALRERIPIVWFIDSAGGRIDISQAAGSGDKKGGGMFGAGGGLGDAAGDMLSLFADSGYLFREQIVMSGVVPQVAAMVGPGAAGTAYIPGLADFVPMVKEIGSMALAGPPLVKAAMGEDVDEQSLGGSKVHCEVSGVGDTEVADDAACIAITKKYLGFMPLSCDEKPPIIPCTDPIDRKEESLLDLVPDESRKPFDMYGVIRAVVDHGDILDIKPKFARNIITCLSRLNGHPVGVVANNSKYMGGIIDNNASDKAAHFIQICDAFNIPLLFFHDVPGFMVGTKAEHAGIIRHGAKFIHTMASATVPKLSVVCRKSYGAGYYAMCGRAYEPDLLVAWPGAEISIMGPEGMVGIFGRRFTKEGQAMAPQVAKMIADMIRPSIDIHKVADWGFVDDLIDPRETRLVLCKAIEIVWRKQIERPYRKHSIMPV